MIKVGLIGCGGMGIMHANCYALLKEKAQVVAVADLRYDNAKKLADLLGCETIFSSAQELIDNAESLGLDMVDVCLPTFLHAEYGIKAMEKGCNLFVEKPVCLTAEEGEMLLEAEKKYDVYAQVGLVCRFDKKYDWLKKCVEEQRYGKVLAGSFKRLSLNPRWSWENWFNDYKRSGTMALDLHIHDVDVMRYIMDNAEPDELNCFATRDSEGVIQHTFTTYRFGDAVMSIEAAWDFPDSFCFASGYRVKMEKATAIAEKGVLTVYPVDGDSFVVELENKNYGDKADADAGIQISGVHGYYEEIDYFIDCINNKTKPSITPLSEAVKSLNVALKEIESAGGAKI